MDIIPFNKVDIRDGFWKQRQDQNRYVTIYSVWQRFVETGRIAAFRCDWKEGDPNKPHIFWDSDVAKWVEAASYILQKEFDKELEAAVEEIVDCIEENQYEDGYFNIYFLVCEPEGRFKKRTAHELYCAGHLIEAAVAYYNATGRARFLNLMMKYADYIERVFVKEQSAAFVTPGHEEIELALYKLYKCTGERRYLELAKFFVDKRGANEKDFGQEYSFANASYSQSHLPVREQTTAEGHCVRACYLYSAMADLAKEYSDEGLLNACRRLFDNITEQLMYITGGIGQSYIGESFTIDYDLPNKTAYAETCAAISLALFARRMLCIEANSVYSDVIERVLYNGMLSGISLDGKAFFYENPLEIDPVLMDKDASMEKRQRYPITQRAEIFRCSCCPPNLIRIIASLGDFIYSRFKDTYYIHQFADSIMRDGNVSITQKTNYPHDGHVKIIVEGTNKIAVRIPGWCEDYHIGARYDIKNGYAYIDINGCVEIDFVTRPVLVKSSPRVQENGGRVALMCGPLVYCLEEVDNGKYLRSICVDKDLNAKVVYDDYLGVNVIMADGYRPHDTGRLYSRYDGKMEKVRLKFIPYFAFANRGESEMIVWVGVR